MKPVLFAVSAEGLVNPTVTSTVLIIIALMHIGIAPAVSKLISPIGVYPSGAVTGTLKSADFQAPKFIVPLVLFILSKLCESPFSWYLAVPRPVLADHINLVVAVGKQNDHSGITGTVKNKTDCISGGHSRHLGCVITCDYDCQSYRASICVGCYAAGNIVADIQTGFQVTILW